MRDLSSWVAHYSRITKTATPLSLSNGLGVAIFIVILATNVLTPSRRVAMAVAYNGGIWRIQILHLFLTWTEPTKILTNDALLSDLRKQTRAFWFGQEKNNWGVVVRQMDKERVGCRQCHQWSLGDFCGEFSRVRQMSGMRSINWSSSCLASLAMLQA